MSCWRTPLICFLAVLPGCFSTCDCGGAGAGDAAGPVDAAVPDDAARETDSGAPGFEQHAFYVDAVDYSAAIDLDGDGDVDNRLLEILDAIDSYYAARGIDVALPARSFPGYHAWVFRLAVTDVLYQREACSALGDIYVTCPWSMRPEPLQGEWGTVDATLGPGAGLLPVGELVLAGSEYAAFTPVPIAHATVWLETGATGLSPVRIAGGLAVGDDLLYALAFSFLIRSDLGARAGPFCVADFPPDGTGASSDCPTGCELCSATNGVSVGRCICGTYDPASFADVDLDGDGLVTASEIASSDVLAPLLVPDVDLDGDGVAESISAGARLELVETTFAGEL